MVEDRDSGRERDSERTTTIIHSDGDRGSGSGAAVAVVALILLAVLLFFLFGGSLGGLSEEQDVNVNIDAAIDVPDVNVNLPRIEPVEPGQRGGDNATNAAQ